MVGWDFDVNLAVFRTCYAGNEIDRCENEVRRIMLFFERFEGGCKATVSSDSGKAAGLGACRIAET